MGTLARPHLFSTLPSIATYEDGAAGERDSLILGRVLGVALAVMSRNVSHSGDRRPASDGGVGAVVIVEVEPVGQRGVALLGGLVETGVGPAIGQGAVESLDLAGVCGRNGRVRFGVMLSSAQASRRA